MNVVNFIFQLLHILNFLTLVVLIPPCLPYTPSINCAHLHVYCVNSSADCDNTFAKCTKKFDAYANLYKRQIYCLVNNV
jgi:hypothetical protein